MRGERPTYYEHLEHTADIAIRVWGRTLKQLFANSGLAFIDQIVDIGSVEPRERHLVVIRGEDREDLFLNWLRELLYLFSTEGNLFCRFEIHALTKVYLEAEGFGEAFHPQKHPFRTEIKGVTYHQFTLGKEHGRYFATVILDV